MSWSVTLVGQPKAVAQALEEYGATSGMSGQSLREYEDAKPHLIGLVRQTVGQLCVTLRASGHATFTNGVKTYGTCSVALDSFYGTVVTDTTPEHAEGDA